MLPEYECSQARDQTQATAATQAHVCDFVVVFFVLSFVFVAVVVAISWVAPAAYGDSQARGPIGAVATGLRQSHSNSESKPHL